MQEIVYMLTHNFEKTDGRCEVLETRFPYLEYPYPGLKTLAGKEGPRYIKTHLPIHLLPPSFSESDAKVGILTVIIFFLLWQKCPDSLLPVLFIGCRQLLYLP